VVLERLAAHESWQAILRAYPELKEEDIQEAILYARASLAFARMPRVEARGGSAFAEGFDSIKWRQATAA